MKRGIVAEFYKSAGGRLMLFSLTVLEEVPAHAGIDTYIGRTGYDVEYSRAYGYLWNETSGGGDRVVAVSGPYFTSGPVEVKEEPTQLVDARDKPPWKGRRTQAIRKRNRTRRLRKLPKAFVLEPGWDLQDWLEHHAIQQDAVYCSTCRDYFPGDEPCKHCWWCDSVGDYVTPTEGEICFSADCWDCQRRRRAKHDAYWQEKRYQARQKAWREMKRARRSA